MEEIDETKSEVSISDSKSEKSIESEKSDRDSSSSDSEPEPEPEVESEPEVEMKITEEIEIEVVQHSKEEIKKKRSLLEERRMSNVEVLTQVRDLEGTLGLGRI